MNSIVGIGGFGSGIQILDRDHRAISEILVELNYRGITGDDLGYQVRLLKNLRQASLAHFALEEGMMLATRFPGLAEHRLRHRLMMLEIAKITASWGSKRLMALQPAGLLWESHAIHVENEDMAFGRWLDGFREPKRRTDGGAMEMTELVTA
jgi:hemerythrin-like metal-binding protein